MTNGMVLFVDIRFGNVDVLNVGLPVQGIKHNIGLARKDDEREG